MTNTANAAKMITFNQGFIFAFPFQSRKSACKNHLALLCCALQEKSFIEIVACEARKRLSVVARCKDHCVVRPDVPLRPEIPAAMDKDRAAPDAASAKELVAVETDVVDAGRGVRLGHSLTSPVQARRSQRAP